MSRTVHANLTADERAERRARRQPVRIRRTNTRAAVVAAAITEQEA
jgi:hypothetical protein